MKYLLVMLMVVLCSKSYAKFLPDNDLFLEDSFSVSGISEEEFNGILYEFGNVYKQIYKNFGLKLIIQGEWLNSEVNAYTYMSGNKVYIVMMGGLARRKELTRDGILSVMCHEAGHTLSGFPFYNDSSMMSSEGQSDYYTTHACHKLLWGENYVEDDNEFKIDPVAREKCDKSSVENKKLCYRSMAAGYSLGKLLANGGVISYSTPDKTKVKYTIYSHPNAQCRLDTYAAGAVCGKEWNNDFVPTTEQQSKVYLCVKVGGAGTRPRCWFAPRK